MSAPEKRPIQATFFNGQSSRTEYLNETQAKTMLERHTNPETGEVNVPNLREIVDTRDTNNRLTTRDHELPGMYDK